MAEENERETHRERETERLMEAGEKSERILCVCVCVTEIKCCTFYGYINITVPK